MNDLWPSGDLPNRPRSTRKNSLITAMRHHYLNIQHDTTSALEWSINAHISTYIHLYLSLYLSLSIALCIHLYPSISIYNLRTTDHIKVPSKWNVCPQMIEMLVSFKETQSSFRNWPFVVWCVECFFCYVFFTAFIGCEAHFIQHTSFLASDVQQTPDRNIGTR